MTAAAPSLALAALNEVLTEHRRLITLGDRISDENTDHFAGMTFDLIDEHGATLRAALQADPVAAFPSERELAPWLRKAVGDMFGECDGVLTEETVIECVQDTLAYLRNTAPPTDALPAADGFVLVPVEPTDAMLDEAEQAMMGLDSGDGYMAWAQAVHAAMIAAAPKPTDEAPPKGGDTLISECYVAMRDAMKLIDPNEGEGREHSRVLNALAAARVAIENRAENKRSTP